MKHLKLFESKNRDVWILKIEGYFYEIYASNKYHLGWTSFFEIFETEEDLYNWVINEMNHFHDKLMDDEDLTEDIKNSFRNIQLITYEDCREFFLSFNDEYSDDGCSFEIGPMSVLGNIQIEEDIKIKISASKYNL